MVGSQRRGIPLSRHRTTKGKALALLAGGTLVLVPVAGTAVAGSLDGCTPAAAWTETVPAKGEPKIVVDNPNYVPEVLEKSHPVVHPAVYKAVPLQRNSWNPKGQGEQTPPAGSTPMTDPDNWTSNTTTYNGTDPLGEVFQAGGGANASWFFWTTRDELVAEAWTETVVDEAYVPAQGEPTIEIDNPDYVPERTIAHPAVTCPAAPEVTPTPTATPTPSATPDPKPSSTPEATPTTTRPVVKVTG